MYRNLIVTTARLLVIGVFSLSAVHAEPEGDTSHAEAGAPPAHHLKYHPHLIALFVGVTTQGRRDGSPTLGLEYGHRFNPSFSIGAVAEHAFADDPFWIYAVPFAYHVKRWKLYVAPGIENSPDHGNEPLLRLGVEYVFDVGPMEISPQLDADFVAGHAVAVMGISFGYGF